MRRCIVVQPGPMNRSIAACISSLNLCLSAALTSWSICLLSFSVSRAWEKGTAGGGGAFACALISGSILVQGPVDCCCGGCVGTDLGGALIQCSSAGGPKHNGGDFGLIGGGPFGSSNLGCGRCGGGGRALNLGGGRCGGGGGCSKAWLGGGPGGGPGG